MTIPSRSLPASIIMLLGLCLSATIPALARNAEDDKVLTATEATEATEATAAAKKAKVDADTKAIDAKAAEEKAKDVECKALTDAARAAIILKDTACAKVTTADPAGTAATTTARTARPAECAAATTAAKTARLAAGAECSEDRLSVTAFLGQVVNNFAAASRQDLLNREDADKGSNSGLVAGFTGEYDLLGGDYHGGLFNSEKNRWELTLFAEAIHSARVIETPCDASAAANPNNPSTEECEAQSDPVSSPGGKEFFKILRDSSTLEWLGGFRWTPWRYYGDRQAAPYLKAQYGFIRSVDAGDDVIDNHFYGAGVMHRTGRFGGSFVEAGKGKTDLFAPGQRSDRLKINFAIYIATIKLDPEDDTNGLNFFVEGFFDGDNGPGSDDIQIYYGVNLDVADIIESIRSK